MHSPGSPGKPGEQRLGTQSPLFPHACGMAGAVNTVLAGHASSFHQSTSTRGCQGYIWARCPCMAARRHPSRCAARSRQILWLRSSRRSKLQHIAQCVRYQPCFLQSLYVLADGLPDGGKIVHQISSGHVVLHGRGGEGGLARRQVICDARQSAKLRQSRFHTRRILT